MANDFTPGPWTVSADGDMVESETAHGWVNDGWVICSAHGSDSKANARLIAASPKLLKALEDLVEAVEREAMIEGVSGIACDKLPDARAAIKEAKGE
jgi:hypothetical protein